MYPGFWTRLQRASHSRLRRAGGGRAWPLQQPGRGDLVMRAGVYRAKTPKRISDEPCGDGGLGRQKSEGMPEQWTDEIRPTVWEPLTATLNGTRGFSIALVFCPCRLPRPGAGRRGRDPMAVSVWHGERANLVNLFFASCELLGEQDGDGGGSDLPLRPPGPQAGSGGFGLSTRPSQSPWFVPRSRSPRASRLTQTTRCSGPGSFLHLLKNLRSGATSLRCSWHRWQG